MAGGIVERTTSTEFVPEPHANNQEPTYSTEVESSISVPTKSDNRSYYFDPDRLIHHYFFDASPQERVNLRTSIASLIKNYNSIIYILKLSRQGSIKDAYDAGVDLIAEFDHLQYHRQVYEYLATSENLLTRVPSNSESQQRVILRLEDFWEILIQGIACAYKILDTERLQLISQISLISQRRIVKAAVIDALVTLSEDMEDMMHIRNLLGHYASPEHETDSYVCEYAQEALKELE